MVYVYVATLHALYRKDGILSIIMIRWVLLDSILTPIYYDGTKLT